jgi:hypothetical protein
VIAKSCRLACAEPPDFTQDRYVNPRVVTTTRKLPPIVEPFVLQRTAPYDNLVPQRHFGDSAKREHQATTSKYRNPDIGGVGAKQRENISTLEAVAQSRIEIQRRRRNLRATLAAGSEDNAAAHDSKRRLKPQ